MTLKIYNTLNRKKEEFKSIEKGKVGMYVCGPTVNDVPHLGHARVQIIFDVFRKYFLFSGYGVKFVSNVTDIEDKIINKANELGISIKELTEKNLKEHLDDYASLGVNKPDIQPRATEYVEDMKKLIKSLINKGYTYSIEGDGIYYDVSRFKNYGKLSGINLEELKSTRELKDISKGQGKKDFKDFVLWKFSKKGEPSWKAKFGDGRPGWHIECSAMTHAILGNPFDIHAGGQDLIFPHHEDEIAQSEAGYGIKMCNYWIHNGMVNVNKIKMSKSLNNFTTIKDLLKKYSGEVIRYFVIGTHYRKPIDFSEAKLNESKTSFERLKRKVLELKDDKVENKNYLKDFKDSMDDDLNTAGALNVLWKLLRDSKVKGKVQTIKKMDEVFGLNLFEEKKLKIPKEIKELLEKRKKAREKKDFDKSDKLRDKIKELGFEVKDVKGKVEVRELK
jgi:cysteinyl-tRNA synthetase